MEGPTEVFGITGKTEEELEEIESPFTADMAPQKGPGSIYDLLLHDNPLNKVTIAEHYDPVNLADVTVDPEQIAAALEGMQNDDDDELSEQVEDETTVSTLPTLTETLSDDE
eukprot:COSAG01_NODE_30698_length_611_cov_0.783203_2_plen_112_part_01